jgi:hypothetical protein
LKPPDIAELRRKRSEGPLSTLRVEFTKPVTSGPDRPFTRWRDAAAQPVRAAIRASRSILLDETSVSGTFQPFAANAKN